MREYKVETMIFWTKFTFDVNHIAKKSKIDIQVQLDEYAAKGYSLHHSTSTNFGMAIYIHLYFEKNI